MKDSSVSWCLKKTDRNMHRYLVKYVTSVAFVPFATYVIVSLNPMTISGDQNAG